MSNFFRDLAKQIQQLKPGESIRVSYTQADKEIKKLSNKKNQRRKTQNEK